MYRQQTNCMPTTILTSAPQRNTPEMYKAKFNPRGSPERIPKIE